MASPTSSFGILHTFPRFASDFRPGADWPIVSRIVITVRHRAPDPLPEHAITAQASARPGRRKRKSRGAECRRSVYRRDVSWLRECRQVSVQVVPATVTSIPLCL